MLILVAVETVARCPRLICTADTHTSASMEGISLIYFSHKATFVWVLATVVVTSLHLACAVLVLPLREALSHSLGGD